MFIKRFQIGKLLGFPIYIDLSWFIIVVILAWTLAVHTFPQMYPDHTAATYWIMGIAGTLGLFASVLLHELGHAVVARRNGMSMRGITLFIFGGVAEMSDEPPSAMVEFLVAIAGPIVSIILAAALAGVAFGGQLAGLPQGGVGVLFYLAILNFILVVFNMIPAFPLDGGRVLRSIIWHISGSLRRATRVTSTIGSGFGMFLIVLGIFVAIGYGMLISGIWFFIIGLFLRNAAKMSYQQLLVRRALEGEPVSRFMNPAPIAVSPGLSLQELVDEYVYRHYHKMYPVSDNGDVLGCVTTAQVKQVPRERWAETRVSDIAQRCSPENTIPADADSMEALSAMSRNGLSRLMVVDRDGALVGVISLKDLLGFLSLKVELEESNAQLRSMQPVANDRNR